MTYILVLLVIVTLPLVLTHGVRRRRDVVRLTKEVHQRGGRVTRLAYAHAGSPFANTGRNSRIWRVFWRDDLGKHSAWALTSRDGIKEWRA